MVSMNVELGWTVTGQQTIHNFRQRISWFSHRWRTQRNAIGNVNCRIPWIIESLNAPCAPWHSVEHACLSAAKSPTPSGFYMKRLGGWGLDGCLCLRYLAQARPKCMSALRHFASASLFGRRRPSSVFLLAWHDTSFAMSPKGGMFGCVCVCFELASVAHPNFTSGLKSGRITRWT